MIQSTSIWSAEFIKSNQKLRRKAKNAFEQKNPLSKVSWNDAMYLVIQRDNAEVSRDQLAECIRENLIGPLRRCVRDILVRPVQNQFIERDNQWIRLDKLHQREGESFDNFLGKLHKAAETCYFDKLDERLLQSIVTKTHSIEFRKQLVYVDKLDLKKAIEMAKQNELVDKQFNVKETINPIVRPHRASEPTDQLYRSRSKSPTQSKR